MTADLNTLVVDVRANTQAFASDVQQLRASFDGIVVSGFAQAGGALEKSLLGAVRRGSSGFEELRRTALRMIDEIAAQALRSGLGALGADGGVSGGIGSAALLGVSSLLGSLLGLPGRATGGPVAPGRPYLVGERGPEVFVPGAAGSVLTPGAGGARTINVSIRVVSDPAATAPQSLARSSRQIAQAVRRALADS